MAEPLAIRRLTPADLHAYKALRDAMLANHPDAFTSDAETERDKPADHYRARLGLDRLEGGHFTLGAWHAQDLQGAISCERDTRKKVRHVGHIVGMMVCAQARGRGLGRALLDACIAQAKSAIGLEILTLSVTASNAAAVALYERAGFTCYGTLLRAVKFGDRYLDKHQMSLTL